MSRSYKKYACAGVCCGCNTDYYRRRNRSTRNKNRHMLRNLLANKNIEDIDNYIYNIYNKTNTDFDTWAEPTDGKWFAKTFKEYVGTGYIKFLHSISQEDYEWDLKYFNKCKRK